MHLRELDLNTSLLPLSPPQNFTAPTVMDGGAMFGQNHKPPGYMLKYAHNEHRVQTKPFVPMYMSIWHGD